MTILKVSSSSGPNMVAGAIAGAVRECGRAELHAVGAGATNQAVKAIAIASRYKLSEQMQQKVVQTLAMDTNSTEYQQAREEILSQL